MRAVDIGPDLAAIDAIFAPYAAPYAVQATLTQTRHTATVFPGVANMASDFVFGGESSYEIEFTRYTAQLLGQAGHALTARCIDDRPARFGDGEVLVARFVAHAFARGLPAALICNGAVLDAWDPRWPLGIPGHALQPAWAHEVLRSHGWRVEASTGSAVLSTGWEPAHRDGVLGALGKAGNLLNASLGGDPTKNLREAKSTFYAGPRGVRLLEERNGVVARDLVLERPRIWGFAVMHDFGSTSPARLFALDATRGACALRFVHRDGPSATAQAVGALRIALACALLGG